VAKEQILGVSFTSALPKKHILGDLFQGVIGFLRPSVVPVDGLICVGEGFVDIGIAIEQDLLVVGWTRLDPVDVVRAGMGLIALTGFDPSLSQCFDYGGSSC